VAGKAAVRPQATLSVRVQPRASRNEVAGLVGAFLVILLHSNFGAHFFTEPYLWLVLGLTTALAAIRQRESQRDTGGEARVQR